MQRLGRTRDLVLTVVIVTLSYAFNAFALDAPHTNVPGYGIECGSCHWTHSNSTAPWENTQVPDAPDNTINNRRCYTCHDGSKSGIPGVKTHSASTTSSMYWTTVGGWKTECITCHDPHQQRQTRAWGAPSHLVTGARPVSIGSWDSDRNRTPITVAETLTENYYGYYFLPDKNYPLYYQITTDTTGSSTFEVKGQVLTAYVKTGGYAIVYGKNVKELINYTPPGGTAGGGMVKLYRSSGANGPGDSGNASSSVCYVCHTQTTHWSAASGDIGHKDGSICAECHEHSIGFKPSCKFCHAYPPTSDNAASPDGLVWVTGSKTGSATAGAHNTHVNTKAIDCEACHYNSVGRNPSHENHKITIGFNNLGGTTQGGTYDGQASANYDVTTTTPATTATNSGTKTCSNVYCHGASMAPNGGSDTTPVWNDPNTAVCGTCHGATAANPPTRGSHRKHTSINIDAYQYPCGLCHKDPSADGSLHVNNKSEVIFSEDPKTAGGNYGGSDGMLDAYGTCTNIYCHSTVQSSPPGGTPTYRTTPTWGNNGTVMCGSCHKHDGSHMFDANIMDSGSHTRHLAYDLKTGGAKPFKCVICHKWNASAALTDCDQCHTVKASKHANFSVDINFDSTFATNGTYNGFPVPVAKTPGTAYGNCSNTYCHSNGTSVSVGAIPNNTSPTWGTGGLTCNACHSYPPDYSNGSPKTNSHPAHANAGITCDKCHNATSTDGSTITNTANHINKAYDLQPGSGVSFTYTYNASGGSCSSISCHGNTDAKWGVSDCLGCHSVSQGNRAAITPQFSADSHHIQGTVSNDKCYQCHWEANSDGTINLANFVLGTGQLQSFISAHGSGIVNLVIYGDGARPTAYTLGTTAVQYTADGSRAQIASINAHCLGCHSDQNNTTTPFGDGKTPKQYSWDGYSVGARYTSTATTTWGKYTSIAKAAKKNITKAYSAHGNATANQEGWNTTTGVDGAISDFTGSTNIACFDCHNSHGSTVSGTTTSYGGGGILKDTTANKGGYSMTYKPAAGGSSGNKNAYNPGAGLCFDCHMNASSGATPWGYSTFGATQKIMGYWDTPYFGPGTFGSQSRYIYKASSTHKGGHFGASTPLSGPPAINGLCTPCHDPHGVSPSLGANAQYAVPLLKGTFMTSPYKEDVTPANNTTGTITDVNAGNVYHIDQNTFASDIMATVTGVTQADSQFAGLCLQCHSKGGLTNGTTHTWKSKDRIHESVKGWKTANGTIKHNYTCSKCHIPHNSRLPRLMATNCLNSTHKGRLAYNSAPVTSGYSGPNYDDYDPSEPGFGGGKGTFPGSNGGGPGFDPGYNGYTYTVTCHESNSADQSWNNKTQWVNNPPTVPALVDAPNTTSTTVTLQYSSTDPEGDAVQYSIQVDDASDFSSPNYTSGWISVTSYTLIVGNNATWYWRVKARDASTESGWSTTDSFMVSDGAAPPQVTLTSPANGTGYYSYPVGVALQWNGVPPLAQYRLEVDDESGFSNPLVHDSGWTTNTSETVNITTSGTYYWRVQARDSVTLATGPVSAVRSFIVNKPPTVPVLIPESDTTSTSITLVWNASTDPEGSTPVQYYLQVDDDPNFGSPNYFMDWSTATSYSFTATNNTWYWRVKAKDPLNIESAWSSVDSFYISIAGAPTAPTLSWPTNGYSGQVGYPAGQYPLQWNASSGAAQYYCEWWGGSSGNSGWTAATSFNPGDLPDNNDFYWHVKARNATGVSDWSATWQWYDYWDTGGGSCPFVYVWDGEKYEYVTDLQGAPIGYSASSYLARFVSYYRPIYVVLDGLKPDVQGAYNIKLREVLPEISYFDEAKLLAVDYPAGYELVSSTGEMTYRFNYASPFKLYAIKDPRPPVSAVDKDGADVLASALETDGNLLPHEISALDYYTFDFGPLDPANAKLVIDGWSVFGSAYATPLKKVQPYIEVVDADGQWVKVKSFGEPSGDMKRMAIDLSGMFRSNDRRIRLNTGRDSGMAWRIDKVTIDDSPPVESVTSEINADYADLHYRGRAPYVPSSFDNRITAEDDVLPDDPKAYGYGKFTKYGDVKALLASTDDMYAIMRHGDEISLTFSAPLAPVSEGMKRMFVLKADVYYKVFRVEKNVEPLPFHEMSMYPYDPAVERYPDDTEHQQYLSDYNTREFVP